MKKQERHKFVIYVMAVLAAIGAIISFYLASDSKAAKGWVAVLWAVGPPIWFWYEYTYLVDDSDKKSKEYRDRLKFEQDIASKIWIAVGGIYTASYFEALASIVK